MRLAAKLMLVFLVVVMIQTALASYFSVRRAFERFETAQREFNQHLTEDLDDRLANGWRERGVDGLYGVIEETGPMRDDVAIRWVWFEEHRLNDGSSTFRIVEQQLIDTGRIIKVPTPDETTSRKLQTYHPIKLKNAPRGGLEITASMDQVEQETRFTILTSLISIGAMSFIAVGLVWIAGIRWVARPLERLIEKTKRIGDGNFSEPLPVAGNDELSQLAGALNDMSNHLASQQQRILAETTERLQTVEQLRHADRLKTAGRLAAGIAHELGTPLNVVSGRAALIASGKLTPDEVESSAQTIMSESDRITNIIRQLLDFTRQNATRSEPVNVSDLLRQTVSLLQPIADKHGVTIELPLGADRTVAADRSQLQQVLTNILVNGIQAMTAPGTIVVALGSARTRSSDAARPNAEPDAARPAAASPERGGVGGPSTDAPSTGTRHPDEASPAQRDYLTISISDQGHGIPSEHLADIFEPFYTTKEIGEGTGLGLSIAYGIIQDHGGWIDVTSTPGQGSCFMIYLPQESA